MDLDQWFSYLLKEPDPRIRKWPMMSSWYPVIFITLGYLCCIYVVGPRYMKNRQPYKLKTFILVYNIFQILANAWLVTEHIRGGWFTKYGFLNLKADLNSPDARMMENVCWWILQLKIVDYIETFLFVLRKKQNQVSFLHVYHHVAVVIFGWISLRYYPDMRGTFATLINCSVHVVMYTYYLCAACGPKIQRIVAPIKPYITKIQMIQFLVILTYTMQVLHPSIEIHFESGLYFLSFVTINEIIILSLFYNFYKKTYVKTSKQKC